MSQQEISKICADSLRSLSIDKYGVKLKASHAHELVAAYFGYPKKNTMLADEKYPITNLGKAEVIVMISPDMIDKRREELKSLSIDLPGSYDLGEAFYSALFQDHELYSSNMAPFKSMEHLVAYFVSNSEHWKNVFKILGKIEVKNIIKVEENEDFVKVLAIHTSQVSENELQGFGQTTFSLKRVTGKIGFEDPEYQIEQWTGGLRKTFKINSEE